MNALILCKATRLLCITFFLKFDKVEGIIRILKKQKG